MRINGSGWEWMEVDGSERKYVVEGESGWEWVGVDGSGCEWFGVDGSG